MSDEGTRPKRTDYGKIVWWTGLLATLGFVATLLQGLAVAGRQGLQLHLFLALAATLLMLFSHLWIVIYLWSLRREVSRLGETGEEIPRLSRAWLVAGAVVLALGAFLLGPVGLRGDLPMSSHATLGLVALALQFGSLWVEKKGLGATDRALGRLLRAPQ